MKKINDIIKDTFQDTDRKLALSEIYLIVIRAGHPDTKTTRNSVRGLIRNLVNKNEIKRVKSSTYKKI